MKDQSNSSLGLRAHSRTAGLVILVALLAGGIAVAIASGPGRDGSGNRPPAPTPAYASDEAKATAEVGAARSEPPQESSQRASLRASINSGALRLDSLPIAELAVTNFGPDTLVESATTSDLGVARGPVVKQETFDGFVLSTVTVTKVLRGSVGQAEVIVAQAGGPGLSAGHAVAVQGSTDPLLRLGHDYVLFMTSRRGFGAAPTRAIACVAGVGRQFEVSGGKVTNVVEPEGWVSAFEGLAVEEFEQQVRGVQ